ncbi:MAG: hypothetical protein ACYDAM_08655 [Leptospirales bacterium]
MRRSSPLNEGAMGFHGVYNDGMKKTPMVRLTTTHEQAKALLETMGTFNESCNRISRKSFEGESRTR